MSLKSFEISPHLLPGLFFLFLSLIVFWGAGCIIYLDLPFGYLFELLTYGSTFPMFVSFRTFVMIPLVLKSVISKAYINMF